MRKNPHAIGHEVYEKLLLDKMEPFTREELFQLINDNHIASSIAISGICTNEELFFLYKKMVLAEFLGIINIPQFYEPSFRQTLMKELKKITSYYTTSSNSN